MKTCSPLMKYFAPQEQDMADRHDTSFEVRDINEDKLEIEFVITSPRRDDFGTRFDPDGMDLTQFRRNPVVLYRHMRDEGIFTLPVARALPERLTIDQSGKVHMIAQFTPEDTFEFGFLVYKMVKEGFLNMASIGAQILEHKIVEEPDGEQTIVFTQWKLFEFSIVPIGANDDAMVSKRAKELGQESMVKEAKKLYKVSSDVLEEDAVRVMDGMIDRAFVPTDPPDAGKADVSEAWSKPTLADFTDKSWDKLSATERRKIAKHFAFAESIDSFSDLKLPHHRASDSAVVFRGAASAAGRLKQAGIPEEFVKRVKKHLSAHYEAFDKEPPESIKEASGHKKKKKDIESDDVMEFLAELDDEAKSQFRDVFGETKEQFKHRDYFECTQPIVKQYRKLLDKLYKRMGLEKAQDEIEAVTRITALVVSPTVSTKETSKSLTVGTRQLTSQGISKLSAELAKAVVEKKRRALASGVPLSKIDRLIPEWTREAINSLSPSNQ